MDPRPTKPDARPAALDATRPARTSAYEATVVRAQQPDEPLTDADRFLSPPQEAGEVGRLGPYRVLGVLGRGGMGAVYRAEDPRLNRQVAVKVLLPDLAADANAKARFRREAQAQAKVEHDHIIPIYEVEEANGVVYLAMPLLKGLTLSAALKLNRRPPVAELVRIGREIAEGLAAAHEVGLIHRDIKPANVWLEGNKRRVKILDFGLAREAGAPVEVGAKAPARPARPNGGDDLTRPGALMGTPAYMSPEQARGQPLDLRSDVFSLGTVLYEMATGRKPFGGATQFDLLAAVATEEPYRAGRIVPDLPPALDALIHRMLAKDPAARPQSCDEVAVQLEAIARALVVPPVVVMPLHSQTEVQNEPNVWEDLDSTYASEHEPATDEPAGGDGTAEGDTEDEGEPAPCRVPKWALPAGGALLAVVVAVVVALLARPDQQVVTEAKAKAPRSAPAPNPNPDNKKNDTATLSDHRAAAEWVLKQNGAVTVKPDNGSAVEVLALDKLSPGPFVVQGVYLRDNSATDAAPAPLAALTNLIVLNIEGPNWTDERLARVFGALKGAAVQTVTVRNFTQALVKTGPALGGLKTVTLQLHAGAAGAIRAADLRLCVPTNGLKLGGVRDTDLDGISEWTAWPKAFDLRKCPALTGAGLDHIHAAGRADRALAALDFDFSETGVTEAEATAFEARFRKSVVKWDGAALPTVRARRAAQVALDRGAVLNVFGTPPVPLARGADLKTEGGFRSLWFVTGDSVTTSAPPGWYTPAKGTVARHFTDDELAALLPDLWCQEIHLNNQNLTDAGAARVLRAVGGDGINGLSFTGCAVGDETLRALAERPALRMLNLNGTKVTHVGLAHLVGRVPLNMLRLAETGLTDDAVPALSAFVWLSDLDLKGTKITPAGVMALRAALPYTIVRTPRGTTYAPARDPVVSPPLSVKERSAAAKQVLFARGAGMGNAGSPVTDPEKWDGSIVNVALYSGTYRPTDSPANGWEKAERTGPVTQPFDAAELVGLFREAGFGSFNSWQFVGQNIDDAGAAALLALPAAQKLKYVQLGNCEVGDATAARLARLPDVIDVYLNNTQVTDAGVNALAEGNPLLRQLRLEGCKGVTNAAVPHLSKMQRLVELDLKGTMITSDGAKQLAAALPYTYIRFDDNNKTQKLERKRDPYKAEAATKLFEARGGALRNGTPAQLSVRAAKYTDPQSPANGWEVARTDGKVEVPFDDADLLALVGDLLACDKPVTSLAFLCLNAQTVTDAGFAALARFPAVRTAHHIELIEMPLGDASAKALAGFPVLTKVALNGTRVGDAGVKALAAEHFGTLMELRLARTRVTDAAVPDLLKMKWLRVLDLHGTAVSPESAAKLAAALPKCAIRYGNDQKIGPKVPVTREEALKKLLDRKVGISVSGGGQIATPKAIPTTGRGVGVGAESGTFRPNNHAGAGWEHAKEQTGTVVEPLTDDDLELFAALALPQIWELNLRGQKITDVGLVPLLRSPGARHLLTVTVADCPGVGDETVRALAELPDLREVYFQRVPLTDAGARALFQSRRGLQRLWLTGCDKLTDAIEPDLAKLFALVELDLKGTSVSATAFERLCKALPHTHIRSSKGQTFAPARREIQPKAGQLALDLLLARGATKANGAPLEPDAFFNDAASTLRIASGPYFEPMGPGIWERARDAPAKEPFGDADLVRYVAELWRERATSGVIPITYLALHKQNLTDAGGAALVALPQLRTAHSVHVTECAVGDEAVKHIAGLPNLKNAYLNRTKVTNAGVKHLVPRAATLDNLRLAHTLVTDAAIDDLLKLTNLTNLDLGGTKVTKEGAAKLHAGLPKCFIRWGDGKELGPK